MWKFKLELPSGLENATVQWAGSGQLSNARVVTGAGGGPEAVVDAQFAKPGSHTVSVTVTAKGIVRKASLQVTAKDANLYARVGSKARAPIDAHGCPACPHSNCTGPANVASASELIIAGLPAIRVGDSGIHAACCGTNRWSLGAGDDEVLYQGKALGVVGSPTQHCGGVGKIIQL